MAAKTTPRRRTPSATAKERNTVRLRSAERLHANNPPIATLPLMAFLSLRDAATQALTLLTTMEGDGSARLPYAGYEQAKVSLARALKATNPAESIAKDAE